MKKLKFLSLILLIAIVCGNITSVGASALTAPTLSSGTILVLNRDTGEVYYSKNADALVYPASTTKIMTVMLALEACERGEVSLDDMVTATSTMEFDLIKDGSNADIRPGETMSLLDFIYCAMISSANEACNVIAEHVGGSVSNFIDMMNARAAELGCTNTHFANTHGLPNDNHFSTASDFALIAMAAAKNQKFMEICSTDEIILAPTNINADGRPLHNSNALICTTAQYGDQYLYAYANGMKTGYTSAAGYCLVSTATKDDINLLICLFGGIMYKDENDVTCYSNFGDSITMYNWVFDNYSYQEVIKSVQAYATVPVKMGSNADEVSLRPETSLELLLPNDFDMADAKITTTIYSELEGEELVAPIAAGQALGELHVTVNGIDYGGIRLVSSSPVELSHSKYIKGQVSDTLHSTPVKIAIAIIIVLLLAYVALVIRYRIIHIQRRKAAKAARLARMRQQDEQLKNGSTYAPRVSYVPTRDEPAGNGESGMRSYAVHIDDEYDSNAPIAPPPTISMDFDAETQAERDYFEEFFKQK